MSKAEGYLGVGTMYKTETLSVSECYELEELESMETLASLEWLWLNICVKLKNIWGVAQSKKDNFKWVL